MTKYKLVAIDIDDTLLTSDKQLSAENIAAIQAATAAGVQIVLTTMRQLTSVKPIAQALGLWHAGQYTITYNGAVIQENETVRVIASNTLSYDELQKFKRVADQYHLEAYGQDNDALYSLTKPGKFMKEAALTAKLLIKEANATQQYFKVMLTGDPKQLDVVDQQIIAHFKTDYEIFRSTKIGIKAISKKAIKGDAVAKLADFLQIPQNQIAAIGDEQIDMSMIQYAGLGIAMQNGLAKVQQLANVVTGSNDENGVAKAIKTYIL